MELNYSQHLLSNMGLGSRLSSSVAFMTDTVALGLIKAAKYEIQKP